MWRLKGCPRCKGDILVDRDQHGWYEWCLQCGYRHDLIHIIKVRPRVKVEKEVAENVREAVKQMPA
jgi:DNA-directed RNA polymerase subunit RPC12/RpoP